MNGANDFDVIIVGGSYSGLAAAMALGRALRKVLIIDSGAPCNKQTPHSHNFLTQDGKTPKEIAALAKQQVEHYSTVQFLRGVAINGSRTDEDGFEIKTTDETFTAKKVIFATGIKDIIPNIEGFSECWGISVLHCPYCHGYEARGQKTGIMGNGDYGFEFSRLISNWTKDLTLFTNGQSTLTIEQVAKLQEHHIQIVETEIDEIEHTNGHVRNILFKDNSQTSIETIYTRPPFEQHCHIPQTLGCQLTEEGYIHIDPSHKTTEKGIFACGDNVSRMRTIANAVVMGTMTAMMVNKELVEEKF
ncbi:MAG TPA: NAD(P)/FAD-dependent oxidoreductase [Patescibacteria group bacterium]|nr:NAD(P)/FAD-dependent oxidoreductase [Patescibacteria group bacterium]